MRDWTTIVPRVKIGRTLPTRSLNWRSICMNKCKSLYLTTVQSTSYLTSIERINKRRVKSATGGTQWSAARQSSSPSSTVSKMSPKQSENSKRRKSLHKNVKRWLMAPTLNPRVKLRSHRHGSFPPKTQAQPWSPSKRPVIQSLRRDSTWQVTGWLQSAKNLNARAHRAPAALMPAQHSRHRRPRSLRSSQQRQLLVAIWTNGSRNLKDSASSASRSLNRTKQQRTLLISRNSLAPAKLESLQTT